VAGPDGAEVAAVEGDDGPCIEAFGEGDDGGVGGTEGEVGVLADELAMRRMSVGVGASMCQPAITSRNRASECGPTLPPRKYAASAMASEGMTKS
jgi:hypothetical protein